MAAYPVPIPSAQVVGKTFVERYYDKLHRAPELVYRFYKNSSLLSRQDPHGLITTVTTLKSIDELICSLDLKHCKTDIKSVFAMKSSIDGVLVKVTGTLTGSDNISRNFLQTFFLAPVGLVEYYVSTDIFRYMEEDGTDTSGNMAE